MTNKKAIVNNRYQLEDMLGQGSMGVVFKAYDRLTGQIVALKQVKVALSELDFGSHTGNNADLSSALAQEFRTVAGLRHPNIISVLDYGFTREQRLPFFTMEYLDNAQGVLEAGQGKSQADKIELVIQALRALVYLHRRKIIHRDLKPDNLMVVDNQVKTLDFGLAVLRRDSASFRDSSEIAGTIAYIAPELFNDAEPHRGSDLWTIGIMLYELLAGKHPFNPSNLVMMLQSIMTHDVDLDELDISDTLRAVIGRLLQKDPANRYDNAADVIDDLYRALGKTPSGEDKAYRESFIQAATFTGRRAELQQLQAALADVQQGKGSAILIGGESGIGKSRLLDELRTQALVEGVTVVRGQGVSEGGFPFQLWRDVLRRLLLAVDLKHVDKRVLKEIVPDIETLLDESIEDAPKLESNSQETRLILSIVSAFKAHQQPTLLILEDLHWAVESLKVLDNLLLWVQDLPLLIVGSYRNDETSNLPDRFENMTSIVMAPLDDDEIAHLSVSILGEIGARSDLLGILKQETEGNCFFLVEVMRALAEDAGSLADVGQMTLPANIFAGGIQQIIHQRLQRLPEAVRTWLPLVALAGRQIDFDLITHLSGEVSEYLNLCANAAVLENVESQWRFRHDKIRETMIAELSGDAKRYLHRRIAEGMETLYADDEDYYEVLLTHWQGADDFDRELYYLEPITKKQISIRGEYTIAQKRLEVALGQLAENDQRAIWILNKLAEVADRQGNYASGIQYAQQAQERAKQHADLSGLAVALFWQGDCLLRQSNYDRAKSLLQQSLEINQQLGDQQGIADSLHLLSNVTMFQGDYETAHELAQQSLKIDQQLENAPRIALTLNLIGTFFMFQGEYSAAQDLYLQSLEIQQQLSNRRGIALCLINLGWIAATQNSPQAEELLYEALPLVSEIHALPLMVEIMAVFALVLAQHGQTQRAVNLVGMVEHHPAKDSFTQQQIDDEIMPLLQSTLTADDIAAGLEAGKALNLDAVMQKLLAEFGDVG